MKYCTHCGNQVDDECVICPKCGCYADNSQAKKSAEKVQVIDPNQSDKSRLIDALLCFFIGGLGLHCFYEGKIGKGVLYIFTFGLFGIGVLVDLIMIIAGEATDKDKRKILSWNID